MAGRHRKDEQSSSSYRYVAEVTAQMLPLINIIEGLVRIWISEEHQAHNIYKIT